MSAQQEIESGDRFAFGANWSSFLTLLDENRIAAAEKSLGQMLRVADMRGQTFLDIGCGSGLFSLAARRLGAQVHSFDFDTQSVACARELKRRYFAEDASWQIEQGSVLDRSYVERLGTFDVVYSWGVLHHTGSMWVAIENAISRVKHPKGKLFIAIYNDQGWKSHAWWFVKLIYNRLPRLLKRPFVWILSAIVHTLVIIKYTLKLKPMVAIAPLFSDRRERGMSARYDAVDWIGGYPFEFASFEVLEEYLSLRGFALTNSRRETSQGCNELVAERSLVGPACAE
ncbi:MAG TPA: methyltransferase domain-containing protein [Steroidobacteraceae bacterium]